MTRQLQLAFAMVLLAAAAVAAGFERNLELAGHHLPGHLPELDSSLPSVTVVPGKLEYRQLADSARGGGQVVEAEVADLDVDGSPEIYIYVQSAGSGSHGSPSLSRPTRRSR